MKKGQNPTEATNNKLHRGGAGIDAIRRNDIANILYRNSTDDSECMRIRFEDVENVIELLNDLYNKSITDNGTV